MPEIAWETEPGILGNNRQTTERKITDTASGAEPFDREFYEKYPLLWAY